MTSNSHQLARRTASRPLLSDQTDRQPPRDAALHQANTRFHSPRRRSHPCLCPLARTAGPGHQLRRQRRAKPPCQRHAVQCLPPRAAAIHGASSPRSPGCLGRISLPPVLGKSARGEERRQAPYRRDSRRHHVTSRRAQIWPRQNFKHGLRFPARTEHDMDKHPNRSTQRHGRPPPLRTGEAHHRRPRLKPRHLRKPLNKPVPNHYRRAGPTL
jgi:hypothetical protein